MLGLNKSSRQAECTEAIKKSRVAIHLPIETGIKWRRFLVHFTFKRLLTVCIAMNIQDRTSHHERQFCVSRSCRKRWNSAKTTIKGFANVENGGFGS